MTLMMVAPMAIIMRNGSNSRTLLSIVLSTITGKGIADDG
jgi:hypothetical protein